MTNGGLDAIDLESSDPGILQMIFRDFIAQIVTNVDLYFLEVGFIFHRQNNSETDDCGISISEFQL